MWCKFARSSNDDDGDDVDCVDCDDDEGLWEGADLHIYACCMIYTTNKTFLLTLRSQSHEFYPGAPAEGVEFRHLRLGFCAQEEDQP